MRSTTHTHPPQVRKVVDTDPAAARRLLGNVGIAGLLPPSLVVGVIMDLISPQHKVRGGPAPA